MASVFDDMFADQFERMLDDLGERVTYIPDGGTPRTIMAMVKREADATASPELRGVRGGNVTITVMNHPSKGIDLVGYKPNRDKIELPLLAGGDPAVRVLSGPPLVQAGGRVRLSVS